MVPVTFSESLSTSFNLIQINLCRHVQRFVSMVLLSPFGLTILPCGVKGALIPKHFFCLQPLSKLFSETVCFCFDSCLPYPFILRNPNVLASGKPSTNLLRAPTAPSTSPSSPHHTILPWII